MRVPILVILPAQVPLANSAVAAMGGKSAAALSKARMPRGIEIDRTYHAVPLASASVTASATIESFAPRASQKFAVRAFVEVESARDIPEESDGHPIFADPRIAAFLTCGGTPPVGTAATVRTKLQTAALAAKKLKGDGVAIAVMDTGINLAHLKTKLGKTPKTDVANSWVPPGTTTAPFQHPLDHGTMCAFDSLIAAPKATLLDFPILSSNVPGGSVVGRTISVALTAFSQLLAFWAVAFSPQGPKYKALVCTNSWGIFHPSWDFPPGHPGRFIDNPNHPFNLIVSALARSGADITFAAGNCGAQCADGRCQGRTTQAIMGASAHPEVLTLAGCDTTDVRVGYSSQGPSIAGMFQQKPDVTSYTHFKGSEAFGANSADSGTSAACPVAAGCIAALRSSKKANASPQVTTSAQMIAALRSSARTPAGVGAGWNGDYGFGILDPVATAAALSL